MARTPKKTPVRRVNSNPQVAPQAFAPPDPTTATGLGAKVDFVRPEVVKLLPKYQKIRDALEGGDAIRAKGTVYLPQPNAADTSKENQARYLAYQTRAVWYGVSERTLSGFIGQVFNAPAVVQLPELLNPIEKDVNGTGVSLLQQAQACEESVLSLGRAGLLVDYPKTDGPVSRQAQLDGSVKPTINLYQPEAIINWRTETIGSKTRLSLVVLLESYVDTDDGFAVTFAKQYRVLRLVNGLYEVDIWRGPGSTAFAPVAEFHAEPKDATGQRLKEIPFTFVGAIDNSPALATPPMYAMADLNVAHYRNSADYEEAVYMTGQATPVITGLTQVWVDEVLEGRIELGSRGAILLPENGKAELLQMEQRTAGFEAMEHKERQMVALGAKLVEQQKVQRTAQEAGQEEAAETSVLSTITNNVSAAYKWALEWAAIFQGVKTVEADANTEDGSPNAIIFELNTDYTIASISSEEMAKVIEAWVKEAITWEEMRAVLKKAGWANEDDKAALAKIRAERMEDGNFDRDNKLGEFAQVDDDLGGAA